MDRADAQEKIKSHIRRRGTHRIDVTEQMVRYWWRICNIALFHSKLHPPKVLIKSLKNDYGYCQINGDNITICISNKCFTRMLFLTTLVHEMVHQWELEQNGRYWGHGKGFHQWQARVKRYLGIDLSVQIYGEDYITDGQRQLHKRRRPRSKRPRAR